MRHPVLECIPERAATSTQQRPRRSPAPTAAAAGAANQHPGLAKKRCFQDLQKHILSHASCQICLASALQE